MERHLADTWSSVNGGSKALIIASVNPRDAVAVQTRAEEVSGLSALRVRDDLPLPMPLDIENADEVGVDRICCAAAAYERVGGACAVASCGTAVTVDCVSSDGRFLGWSDSARAPVELRRTPRTHGPSPAYRTTCTGRHFRAKHARRDR